MKRKGRLPFDPKVFLSKVNGGRAISDYRKDQIVYTQGETRGFCFLHSERQGQEDRRLRAGEGSRGRTSGNRGFLWGRVLERTAAASGNSLRHDGMRDRANNKGRHYPRDPRRASVWRVILSRTSWLATVVLRRIWSISCSIRVRKRLARILLLLANFGKDGRPEPIIAKISQETLADMIGTTRSRVSFFHEQISGIGLCRLQRRPN